MVTLKDMEEYKEFMEKKLGGISEIENVRVARALDDFKEECDGSATCNSFVYLGADRDLFKVNKFGRN